jgi:hypothetical protein
MSECKKVKKESAWRHANIQTNKPKGNNINQLIYDYIDASLEKNKIKKNKMSTRNGKLVLFSHIAA